MTSHHNPLLHASHSEAFVTFKNHKNMTIHVCDVVTFCDEHVTRECRVHSQPFADKSYVQI